MTSIELPGSNASTLESATVVVRRLAALLAAIVVGVVRVVVPHLFTIGALAAFCVAGFNAGRTTGFIVVGACLLIFEWKLREGSHGTDRR